MAAQSGEVQVRGPCMSACTLVLSYISKNRLCFDDKAVLGFHKVRYQFTLANGPDIAAESTTTEVVESYPEDIRAWIDSQGGQKRMPMDGYWYLWAKNLWAMGYRKCDG
jgi:hypothetical protein